LAQSGDFPLAHFLLETYYLFIQEVMMALLVSRKSKRNAKKRAMVKPDQVIPRKRMTKTTDNKGRVALGGGFANRAVIIEQLSETEVVVKLARVIPEREAWLYENKKALTAVRNGLAQARAGKVTAGPDMKGDADLARQLED
jgi:hypothetical protein